MVGRMLETALVSMAAVSSLDPVLADAVVGTRGLRAKNADAFHLGATEQISLCLVHPLNLQTPLHNLVQGAVTTLLALEENIWS